MRHRRLALVVTFVITATACTRGAAPDQPAPALPQVRDVVVLQTGAGIATIDPLAGILTPGEAGAVASFDGTVLFRADPGDTTTIETIDPATGLVVATAEVEGELDVRVASIHGEQVALMAPLADGADPWIPVPRARTKIAVASPGDGNQRDYLLEGNFEPEAFSADGGSLFLIQYLPAEDPQAYRVVTLDLVSGDVDPVFGRFKTPPERMPGERLSQVYDPVRERLYTLYTNGHAHGLTYGGEEMSQPSTTFVHVLSLREGWAYCADVPKAMWGGDAMDQGMAVSPNGRRLYVLDAREGLLSSMNTTTLRIEQVARVALGLGDGLRTSVTIGGDTMYLSASTDPGAIHLIDVETLALVSRWTVAEPVGAIGLSPDGSRLYAAGEDGVTAFDVLTGAPYATLQIGGVGAILGVQTPAPA